MNNIEEYQNLVGLLKKALEFYANTNNYKSDVDNAAMIDLDEYGSQARFALKKIQEVEKMQKELEQQFVNDVTKAIENNEGTNGAQKIIEDFKNLINENNNIQ